MRCLAKYQDVQAKVRGEIDEVLGANKMPSMSDKLKMPYTKCLLYSYSCIMVTSAL